MKNKKEIILIFLISLLFLCLDQISKYLVVENMEVAETIQVVRNFFRFSYVQNTGAAWSMFTGSGMFLILTSILILGFFLYFIFKKEKLPKSEIFIYASLIGGILGNLIDRIRCGYVIDFLDFNLGGFDFPVFNLADTFIVIAGFILIYKILKEET